MNSKKNKYPRTLKRNGVLKLKTDFSAYILLIPSLILLFILVWRPIYSGFVMSLHKMQGYNMTEFVGLDNYKAIIHESLFKTAVWNSVKYVFWSILIGFIPPIFIAIMMCELRKCKGFTKFAVYFPGICPAIVTSLLWTLMYEPSAGGLLNTFVTNLGMEPYGWLNDQTKTIMYIIVSMSWAGFGSAAILYLATLEGLPRELFEAAMIDGASIFQRIRYITLPQMSGIILLMLIRNISGVFQIMEQPLAMTGGGPNNASLSLGLLGYRYGFVYFQLDKAVTVGFITFALLFIITLVYFRVEKKVSENG